MRNIEEQIIASLQASDFSHLANKPIRQTSRPFQICLVEPINVFDRSQPVSIEVIPIAGRKEEMLSLKTPLGGEANFQLLLQKYLVFQFPYEEEYPMVKMCYDPNAEADDLFRVYMRVDLPLMPFIKEGNPLSNYELNEALKDLVECGDLVERLALSGQDLNGMDLHKGKPIAGEGQVSHLRKGLFREKLGQAWVESFNPKYVFLDKIMGDLPNSIAEHWAANHRHPFAKFLGSRDVTGVSLSYFAKDIQREEQDFLATYFSGLIKHLSAKRPLMCGTNT